MDPGPASLASLALPPFYAHRGTGILTCFPFSHREHTTKRNAPTLRTAFAVRLGPTDPTRNALPSEPFPNSAETLLKSLVATTTKIFTRDRSTQAHAQRFHTGPRVLLHTGPPHDLGPSGGRSVARLSAIHFQGFLIRLGSCYTLIDGFRLPWPPTNCLNQETPFVVPDERTLGHLNTAFGSSRIASSAYQNMPTNRACIYCQCSTKQQWPVPI